MKKQSTPTPVKPAKLSKKKERRLEKELLVILVFIGVLVGIFFLASWYFKSLHSFEYKGLAFSEERAGNIPIFHHSYFFKAFDGRLINYNLYIRTDPRTLDSIPVTGNKISFSQQEVVFISVNATGLQQCPYSPLAVASISSYLADNQMKVKSGNLDFWDAGYKRQDYVNCDNQHGNKVIEITTGNETKITVNGKCYRIEIADCQVLQGTERFEVQAILDAQKVKV